VASNNEKKQPDAAKENEKKLPVEKKDNGEVPKQEGWGWSKPDALTASLPAPQYLDKLADAADEWFKQRPENALALAKRIAEFRQGCSMLILSTHKQLPPEERVWLVNRCKTWAAKLSQQLTDLEAGRTIAQVLEQTDATAKQISSTLRSRSDSLRS
jgi:hypothetical protein